MVDTPPVSLNSPRRSYNYIHVIHEITTENFRQRTSGNLTTKSCSFRISYRAGFPLAQHNVILYGLPFLLTIRYSYPEIRTLVLLRPQPQKPSQVVMKALLPVRCLSRKPQFPPPPPKSSPLPAVCARYNKRSGKCHREWNGGMLRSTTTYECDQRAVEELSDADMRGRISPFAVGGSRAFSVY